MRHLGFLESNLSGSGFEGLRVAKELGLHVTFITRSMDRYLAIPGGPRYFDKYVDEIVHCETNDLQTVLSTVLPLHARAPFAGFLTFGEYDVVAAAATARELGLPTTRPDGVAVARNKFLMRERCARAGIAMPGFAGVESESEARDAAVSLGLPCVVKPADETASFDVARCSTLSEVTAQFRLISGKAANIRGQRRFPKILVEEYARGFEVSVEVIAEGERVQVLGVTDKSVAGNGRFVEVGHVFPSLLPPDVVASCADLAVAALRAVGFDLGMAHVEIRVTEDGPKLIEINARPAGGGITDLVDAALSISCLELVIRQYLGEPVLDRLAFALFASRPRGAAVRFLTAAPGRVTSVGDLTPAEGMPGVRKVKVSVSAGDTVNPLERNIDRLGYVFTVADHAYLAARQAESAASEVEILTSPDQRSELEAVA